MHCSDAFFKQLKAELGIAQFVAGVLLQLTASGRRCHCEVSFEFGDARTHLPRLVLTQRLYPAPPAHPSSRNSPNTGAFHAIKTLTPCKCEYSKFNGC